MECQSEGLQATVRAQLIEDVLNVITHCGRANTEGIGNFLGVLACREKSEDLLLSFAQWKCVGDLRCVVVHRGLGGSGW